jgi:hypothetical protein
MSVRTDDKRTSGDWRGRSLGALARVGCLGFAIIGSSCNLDPVHHAAVAALGDEDASRYPPNSAYHRPGEPCTVCHSDRGSASRKFALAGTVFWGPDSTAGGVDWAYVFVTDAGGGNLCLTTNCAGNFYLDGGPKTLTFPLSITVQRVNKPGADETNLQSRTMNGHIGRESSCAGCHLKDIIDFGSPGNVRLFSSPEDLDAAKGRGAPIEVVKCPPADTTPHTCPGDRQ